MSIGKIIYILFLCLPLLTPLLYRDFREGMWFGLWLLHKREDSVIVFDKPLFFCGHVFVIIMSIFIGTFGLFGLLALHFYLWSIL